MIPLELDGDNLGKKYQHYNRLLKEILSKNDINLTTNFNENGDIENLLKIDVACINKNVNFILEVLKCEDMLYISRAVKRSTWLITEPEYAHIINIDYLNTHLFPFMLTKAINKLMLSIRIHIKDEKRAEEFFEYEKQKNIKKALKWLPQCSLPFIEQAVAKHIDFISMDLIKRLCERSISVLEAYINHKYLYPGYLTPTLFLINNNAEKYLNLVGKLDHIPYFRRKHTEIVMKTCPQIILDNFERFWDRIDHATCAKYMKREDIKPFLLKQASNEKINYCFISYDNLKYFLLRLPIQNQLELIKQLKIISSKESYILEKEDDVTVPMSPPNCDWTCLKTDYQWYRLAPFDVAFRDLKKIIRTEASPVTRNLMLTTILYRAGNDIKNIQTLLQYYYKNHINEPLRFKIKFLENVLKNIDVVKNKEMWSIVNRLFHSMEVYIESSDDNIRKIVDVIIICNAVNEMPNSKVIEDKFSFSPLKEYKNKLLPAEKEKVFKYLHNHVQEKIQKISIINELCFNEVVTLMKNILELLNDWEKKLHDYPLIINKIKELVALKRKKSWNSDLSMLYHVNKTWRKHLFEESIILSPSGSVCINALKHDPRLLSRNESELHKLCYNDPMALKIVLRKIRVYWPLSLTTEWTNFYFQHLDDPSKQNAAIKVLMLILPHDQLKDLIIKYAPKDTKINWGEVDEVNLSLRKHLAKNMFLSRRLIPVEMILLYAKGDYLQYCVPSLNSILYNVSTDKSGPIVQKLLTEPVSLQKYGIRLAFSKLKSKDLKRVFSKAWKSTTNPIIRAVLYQKTHDALCNETNIVISEEIWDLLSDFIDNLTYTENRKIYKLLGEVKKIPYSVRGKFYMKSYAFLKSMAFDDFIQNIIEELMENIPNIVNLLDIEYTAEVMLKGVNETFNRSICRLLDVITTTVLFSKDEETQLGNYERILAPLLDHNLPLWDTKHENQKYVQTNMKKLLDSFTSYLKYVLLDRNKVIPVKVFKNILNKLETSLLYETNYVFKTTWKLLTSFIELVNAHRYSLVYVNIDETQELVTNLNYNLHLDMEEKWDELFRSIIPFFAKTCTDNLQIDVGKYSPSIYILYGQAVENIVFYLHQCHQQYLLFKRMLAIDESIENYLLVINYCSIYPHDGQKPNLDEIRRMLEAHPSPEIKLHCIEKFHAVDLEEIKKKDKIFRIFY